MTRNERVGYLLCTIAGFISGFIIFAYFGIKGPWAPDGMSQGKVFMFFGLAGGLAIAVTLSGVILTTWVVRESSMIFKIIISLLWPVTAACAVCVGVVTFIPYEIFNVVKIFMPKKPAKQTDEQRKHIAADPARDNPKA